jgi:hypothetical protein
MGALARAVVKAKQLLLALRRGADDNQDALRLVFHARDERVKKRADGSHAVEASGMPCGDAPAR